MKQPTITILILAALLSAVAAFFKPAVPHQVPAAPAAGVDSIFAVPRGGASAASVHSAFDDAGLDNDAIEADTNISPSRKVLVVDNPHHTCHEYLANYT
jgi:hypothetical protein